MVIEQFDAGAAARQPFRQAPRLPVGTVVDALVEGQDADARAAHPKKS
jgi:hypothetical protein